MRAFIDHLRRLRGCAVFTGAGVSTLCGIPDFRGAQGLYRKANAERIFDLAWFRRDPAIYYQGCQELIYGVVDVAPGAVHQALARLETEGVVAGIITQNIDMLHQKAGSQVVHEIHGSPALHRCFECGDVQEFATICAMLAGNTVARCRCGGAYKPDITFFGEALPQAPFAAATALARRAPLMLVLGSSLTVYPAASIPEITLQAGGELAIVNAQPTPLDRFATWRFDDLVAFAAAVTGGTAGETAE